jgi:hypothetical protein
MTQASRVVSFRRQATSLRNVIAEEGRTQGVAHRNIQPNHDLGFISPPEDHINAQRDPDAFKVCKKCGVEKRFDEFHKKGKYGSSNKPRRAARCRACISKSKKKYNENKRRKPARSRNVIEISSTDIEVVILDQPAPAVRNDLKKLLNDLLMEVIMENKLNAGTA